MQSLRDKLMKAGLITEDQAKKADNEPRSRPRTDGRPASGNPSHGRPAHARSGGGRPASAEKPIPKLPPLPGSREHQRLISKQQVDANRKIRELVLANEVPVETGEQTFYFVTRKNRLRRLELTPAQAKRLEIGELAVVERPDPDKIEHALVPPAIADQLLGLSDKAVRFFNRGDKPVGFISDSELKERQEHEAANPEQPVEASVDAAEASNGVAAPGRANE